MEGGENGELLLSGDKVTVMQGEKAVEICYTIVVLLYLYALNNTVLYT